jgi:hypothetical protein
MRSSGATVNTDKGNHDPYGCWAMGDIGAPDSAVNKGLSMNAQALINTAKTLVTDDKGLLAMDESNPTCNRRFAQLGIPQTEKARRAYRELIVTTPGLGEYINGAILYDETIRQRTKDGASFSKALSGAGIIPGIKVDIGTTDLAGYPGEKITEGLDGLRDRLKEYFQMGARFAKWRVVTFPAPVASRLTLRRWPVMPRCAKRREWSPSSSRRCLWTVNIPWNSAP